MQWRTVVEQAAALVAALDAAAIPPDELPAALASVQALGQMAQARVVALLRRCEVSDLPSALGAAHPVPWGAGQLKVCRSAVHRLRRLGVALEVAPAVGAAYLAGGITGEQAKLMAATVAVLPSGSEPEVLSRGADLGPDELRSVLRELEEELDPQGAQERAEIAAELALRRAEARRQVQVSRLDGDNLVQIRGFLDCVDGAAFLAILDALSAPHNRSALGVGCVDGVPDVRTAAQRRHDAICEIGNPIAATGTVPDHGGDRPQAVVTVSYETLVDGVHGLGLLDDGTVLTPAACRLLACDARILPVVMSGQSMPVDLGRLRRLFTGAVRRALGLRDRGCAWPGCDRGIAWTQAHHCVPWHQGGRSDLANGVLVCGFHHRSLHHSAWRVWINPADGLPDFFAPGDDRPRRNHYHRRP